jgi:hypothetical protein
VGKAESEVGEPVSEVKEELARVQQELGGRAVEDRVGGRWSFRSAVGRDEEQTVQDVPP